MKVLHVIPSLSSAYGGPSRAMADIERALCARGIEVTTITTNDDGGTRTLAVECETPISTNGVVRWYFPRDTAFYAVSIRLARWLKHNIHQFDIVHAHGLFSYAPVRAAKIAKRAHVPYVLRPFGVLNRYGMTQRRPWLKQISLTFVERPLIESASAVHFTSRAEQLEVADLKLNCKATVIPLGIDVGTIARKMTSGRYSDHPDGPRLLYLSRIDPKKNLESLLGALSRLRVSRPDFILDIAGDGQPDYVSSVKKLVSDLQISDRVRWHGHVDDRGKIDLFLGATAFVLPSLSENFGIAVVEALAAGVPCVVTREVAIHDEIEKAGAGVIVGTDSESIALGLDDLLSNKSRLKQMRSAALRVAETFSLAAMGERLENLYQSMAAAQKRRPKAA
jgi:glycosyltransferase involved in cell wall biosynthesis